MSEVEDISIKIDYDIAHNGEHITLISVSPNGKYVITYSNKDHSIEGWIVDENDSKCSPLIRDPEVTVYKLPDDEKANEINEIKVNDDRFVLYAWDENIRTFRMSKELSIKPSSLNKSFLSFYFKNDGDLVISKKHNNRISVYSHVGGGLKKKKKLSRMIDSDNVCKVMFENNKVCLIASNNLFQCDLDNFKFEFSYSLEFDEKDVEKIIMRENLILLKYNEKNNEKISIYLKEIHFPIRNIQVESNVSIRILSNNYFITFNLTKEDEKQDLSLHHTTDINKQPVDRSRIFNDENDFILFEYNSESQRAFGFVEESVSSIKLTRFIWHELFATNHGDDEIIVGWNTYLHQTSETQCNDTMVYPDMENIRALVSNQDKTEDDEPIDINFNNQKYKWRIDQKNKKLSIFKLSSDTNGELCSTKLKEFKEFELVGIHWRILNNNALAQTMRKDCRLEHRCIIIYKYNIINKDIKMHYFYFDENFTIEKLSGTRLPIMNFEAFFKHNEHFLREWLENIIEDDRCLAIYGEALLPKFINEKSSNYIEKIYSKCTNLVKEDPKKNLKFLNIITLSMNDLYKTYPDYISKFNSEMYMILNPSDEHIISGNHFDDDLYTFNEEFPIDQSFRAKFNEYYIFYILYFLEIFIIIWLAISKVEEISLSIVQILINIIPLASMLVVYLIICYIPKLTKLFVKFYMFCYKKFVGNVKVKQYITLIVPYLNYSCYPLEYSNFIKEMYKPQSSVFVNTCQKDFYTNWNGEAVIDFKWKKFGRNCYNIILLKFMVFFVCFTVASYPSNIRPKSRDNLYTYSIIMGIAYLVSEFRQLTWNLKKYIFSIWNWIDLSAYISVILTSCWTKYGEAPYWALSVSCLLLDLKFLLFFRVFEYFGVYFVIIFGVAKRVFSFLVVLAIILASFAHAFFILLHPRDYFDSLTTPDPSDPNNPWTISNTFYQTDEDGNILNQTLIQTPDENTNLFYSYPTSLLAMYLFLTGNQGSLSSWGPSEYKTLFILLAVFSFLVVIYLMNLFIGLLNMEIGKDNDRASFLAQKAEIIAEIELFYLPVSLRRNRTLFPEVIYYRVDVEMARRYIKEAIKKGDWNMEDWPEMKRKILKLLNIEDAIKRD